MGIGREELVDMVALFRQGFAGEGCEGMYVVKIVGPVFEWLDVGTRAKDIEQSLKPVVGHCREHRRQTFLAAIIEHHPDGFAERKGTHGEHEGCLGAAILCTAFYKQCVLDHAIFISEIVNPHENSAD